ncbi:hypothetical protein Bca52824_024607 [Brassica carinata]|uniref:Uncharacterized protein n=1 Tax=Brassica carinata TaxID=52824 RepID=A0A8X7VLH0_BRACI|nr:hypothetical protein Bca52824_024607 [Brassica carinata]
MEDVKTKLLHRMHDEFQKMKIGMTESFRSLEAKLNHMVEIIMKVAADLQVPEKSMELYNKIYEAPIFDVYDYEEPSYDDAVPIFDVYGDEDLVFDLGCEYFEKNIQVNYSKMGNLCTLECDMYDSSFAPSRRNNDSLKEFIDVSHVEARSISAQTYTIQSHKLLTATPKKLSQEEPVSGKPPPLRDKEVVQILCCYGEET